MLKRSILSLYLPAITLLFLPAEECTQIIGGAEVRPHSLPYMVYLDGKVLCGGALINPQWVVTAAHCKGVKRALLGVHSISKDDESSWQKRYVNDSIAHPEYDPKRKVNDIMVLKLNKRVKKTATVSFLQLPYSEKALKAGVQCTVAGWGAIKNKGKQSDVLRSANVTIISHDVCNSKKYYNLHPVITEDMLCAGSVGSKRSDSCQGDSGGPLLCEGIFRGITSFGTMCGIKTRPGVYTALSTKYIKWIKKTISSESR